MGDYRLDYISGKIADATAKSGDPVFGIGPGGKMLLIFSDGFELEVVPAMKRSITYTNKETNEITTITKSSVSVRKLSSKPAPQMPIPGVGDGQAQ